MHSISTFETAFAKPLKPAQEMVSLNSTIVYFDC